MLKGIHLQHIEHQKQQPEGKSSQPCSHLIQAWEQSYQGQIQKDKRQQKKVTTLFPFHPKRRLVVELINERATHRLGKKKVNCIYKARSAAHLWLKFPECGDGKATAFTSPYQPEHCPRCSLGSALCAWLLSSYLLGTAQEDSWREGPLLQPNCCGGWCSQPT